MKPATEKKVKEIKNRAKNLKASYVQEVRALSDPDAKQDDKLIPRVSAIVIREGNWLLKIANKFIDRHGINLSKDDTATVLEADKFFKELSAVHEDEILKNEFIYRLPVEFILHLEKLTAMILVFDADVKAKIARIEADDVNDDLETAATIAADMIG